MARKTGSVKAKSGFVSREEFFAQYKHPLWQKRRLERLEVAGWACERCEEKTQQLHVHHNRYVTGRRVWEYTDDELRVLCDACHEYVHARKDRLKDLCAGLEETDVDQVIGYVSAILALQQMDDVTDVPMRIEGYEEAAGVADYIGLNANDLATFLAKAGGHVSIKELWSMRLTKMKSGVM